ncbi:MAG: hypothetical protein FJ404_15770 [Verrucomicrobia bacterium]|nr:hypothetical protein [Verrucomicrobiota bacterium]
MKPHPESRDLEERTLPASVANPLLFRDIEPTEFEKLKASLLREAIRLFGDTRLLAVLRRAANEAEALAWTTPYPALFYPELFMELARASRSRAARQESVHRRSRFLAVAR